MKTRVNTIFLIIIVFAITCLSLAYSSSSATAEIENVFAQVKPQADARITSISRYDSSNGGVSNSEDYNINNIYGVFELPNNNSTVTYKIDVTVFYGSEMKLTSINGLNSNLEYSLTNYTLNDPLCNSNDECNYGATASFYITIGYKENGYDGVNTSYAYNLEFVFEEISYIARIGNVRYETLQGAINAVPTNNTETTVMLLKNTSEIITIAANKKVRLSMQSNTISNDGGNPVIANFGTLYITDGVITSNASQGAINNKPGASLYISGGRVIATGARQALYNEGGYAEISDNAYLSTTSNQRAAVHNFSGTMVIKGGTIISTRYHGVVNAATLTIGEEDGTVDPTTPVIRGLNYGIVATSSFDFYDGILKGKTRAIEDETYLGDIEDGNVLYYSTETIDGTVYKTVNLAVTHEVTFNANGGTVDEATRIVQHAKEVGQLPVPIQTGYVFEGWYTQATGGNEVTSNTIINNDIEFFAHWISEAEIVVAKIGTTEYNSLQKAINAVPTNNTETTITLVRNTSEVLTVRANKKIILDLQNYTISNSGVANVIVNYGNITLISGTITSNTTQGAINNESGGKFTMTGGKIIATGTRQAIYNNGGTLTITGSAELKSSSTERATVQNLASGTINITGGTITSTGRNGVENAATLTIGTKDGNITTSSPVITGATDGVVNSSVFNFYDGTINGVNSAINGTINEIETGSEIVSTVQIIGGVTYESKFLR